MARKPSRTVPTWVWPGKTHSDLLDMRLLGRSMLIVLLGIGLVGCTNTQTTILPTEVSSAGAPWGLDRITQPDSHAAIDAVFGRMPAEIAGAPKELSNFSAFGEIFLAYANAGAYKNVGSVSAWPAASHGDPVGYLRDQIRYTFLRKDNRSLIEAQQLDPSASLVYLVYSADAYFEGTGRERWYDIFWADPGSNWVYTASSSDPAVRRQLVEAFVAAIGSSG